MARAEDWTDTPNDDALLKQLVALSRYYGQQPRYVIAGGGNTSVKSDDTLHVKASGTSLGTIDADGFVPMDRSALDSLLTEEISGDATRREARVKDALLDARLDPTDMRRPSVEALLHHLLSDRFVVHTHPTAVNALACCENGQALCEEIFGEEVLWVPFVEPGYVLARTVCDGLSTFRKATGKSPMAIVMQNHGLIVGGATPEDVKETTARIVSTLQQRVELDDVAGAFGPGEGLPAGQAETALKAVAPALRALLAESDTLKIVTLDDSPAARAIACGADGPAAVKAGPLTPDQIVYCGSYPLWFETRADEQPDQAVQRLRSAVAEHAETCGMPPKVVVVNGLGVLAAGDDLAAASAVRDVYHDALLVMVAARKLGGIRPLSDEHRAFIENWEAEAYRRDLLKLKAPAGRVSRKVAMVTGAAQGFGLEIAQHLAAEGALVVLADINAEGAAAAAEAICREHGDSRAMGLAMNVTDAGSICEAVSRTVKTCGGLDLLIANAGVLKAESVKTQPEKDFDFVTSVNYKGYYLCVQQVAPVLAVQHAGRESYWSDIIQVNSKSGLVGSNRNFAYAGSKFGGIGLTQSFALELVEDGVKVNSICPGNFYDGPLWSDPENGLFVQYLRTGKVPGAKTVEDVRRAYEAKTPIRRGCTTPDVMKAVYYLVDQKFETGQALPVTGGQVMLN
ncbi:MAG: SDR family NAD(P)-dependent oxidoreductase [Phycisphaerae bacterium]